MIVEIADDGVRLTDAADFTRFDVVVSTEPASVADALAHADAGRLVGDDHAAIRVGWLTTVAGEAAATEEWRAGFAAMLAYAGRKGWMTEHGEVLGHLVAG